MSTPVWTLSDGTTEKTLAAWGIKDRLQVTFKSGWADELSFDLRPASVLADPPFAQDDELYLMKDSVTWFRGFVRLVMVSGQGKSEVWTVTVRNAWEKLERLTFLQPRMIYQAPTWLTTSLQDTSDVILCNTVDPITGKYQKCDSGVQIDAIIAFALGVGVPLSYQRYFVAPNPPSENARDLTCAAAIRRMLNFSPDVVSWVDYTNTPYPKLHMDHRLNLSVLSLDLSAGNLGIEEVSLSDRADVVPAGVVLRLLYNGTGPDGKPYTQIKVQTAGATSGPGVIVNTVDWPTKDDGTFEDEPTGRTGGTDNFAQYYYTILSRKFFAGTIRFHQLDCPGTIRPGMVLNFTGTTRTGWDTALAVVQQVTEDPFYGRTTVTMGPPPQLDIRNVVALGAMAMKTAKKDAKVPAAKPPTTDGTDSRPMPGTMLTLCDGTSVAVH